MKLEWSLDRGIDNGYVSWSLSDVEGQIGGNQ